MTADSRMNIKMKGIHQIRKLNLKLTRGAGTGTEVSAEKRKIVSMTIHNKIIKRFLIMEDVKLNYEEQDTEENADISSQK